MSKSTWSRRAALGCFATGGSLIALETFGFSRSDLSRETEVTTSADADALLSINELKDGPIYDIPHDLTVTNNFDQEVTVSLESDSNGVSIDSTEFNLAASNSKTIMIDHSDLTCDESGETTISVDATGAEVSVDLERPITLKNKPGCVETYTYPDDNLNLNWNNEDESCFVKIEGESQGDIDIDVGANNTAFEECLNIDVDAKATVDIDMSLEETTIEGDLTIKAIGEDTVQWDYDNIEADTTTIRGDLIVEAYGADLDNVPDESTLENELGTAVDGEISVTKSTTVPVDDDPPESGVETVDDSAPVGEDSFLKFALQIAEGESRTVTDFEIATPGNTNDPSDEFDFINNTGQSEVELTIDGTGSDGEANETGNTDYATGTEYSLDETATFEDGATVNVTMGEIQGGNVQLTYDVVYDGSAADIAVTFGFDDNPSHTAYLQVSNINT